MTGSVREVGVRLAPGYMRTELVPRDDRQDSEHPDTLRYVREIAAPYAAEHGIELVELHRERRDGTRETLLERAIRPGNSFPLPMFGEGRPLAETVDDQLVLAGMDGCDSGWCMT